MSFDLMVLVPALSQDLAERFNRAPHPALPDGMRFATETCGDASRCWEVHHDADVWAELYPAPRGDRFGDALPQAAERLAGLLYFPNRAQPEAFHLAADLAEVADGLVFDPQCVAEEFAEVLAEAMTDDARGGFYSPALTRRIAEEIRRLDG